jgi:hypothetical protein
MKVPPGLARFDGEFIEVLALNTLCQPNALCGRGPELAQATATPSVVAIQQFAVWLK